MAEPHAPGRWVLLAYRMPREPSTPRIAVWRKLRRLGVAQILDGLVALPFDARTQEQLEWLADEITDAGGEASLWVARPGSRTQERQLAQRMSADIAAEYRAVQEAATEARAETVGARRRTLGRLRRELRRIRSRDYFPPPEADRARAEVEALAHDIEVTS